MRQAVKVNKDGSKTTITIKRCLVLLNFWEYFIIATPDISDDEDVQFAYVNGDFDEFGYVSMSELRRHKLSESGDMMACLAPVGFEWSDEL